MDAISQMTFYCFFLKENVWNPIKISLKFVPKGSINNIPALVQIMALRRPGDKPLSEPMMVNLPTHICVTGPLWANGALWNIQQSHLPTTLQNVVYIKFNEAMHGANGLQKERLLKDW